MAISRAVMASASTAPTRTILTSHPVVVPPSPNSLSESFDGWDDGARGVPGSVTPLVTVSACDRGPDRLGRVRELRGRILLAEDVDLGEAEIAPHVAHLRDRWLRDA